MFRGQETGVEHVGKNMWRAAGGQVAVETCDFRQAATEHDNLRIQDIDDAGQGSSQTPFVALQAGLAACIASTGQAIYLSRVELFSMAFEMVERQRRAG